MMTRQAIFLTNDRLSPSQASQRRRSPSHHVECVCRRSCLAAAERRQRPSGRTGKLSDLSAGQEQTTTFRSDRGQAQLGPAWSRAASHFLRLRPSGRWLRPSGRIDLLQLSRPSATPKYQSAHCHALSQMCHRGASTMTMAAGWLKGPAP